MRLAIVSDIHDNIWKLAAALAAVQDADCLICCGDLCSPFIVHQLARGFSRDIHIVFGNNDADTFRITRNAAAYPHLCLHGEFLVKEFGERTVAVNHFDHLGMALARSGQYDAVFYGHNHVFEIQRLGRTLAVNPGAIMGARPTPAGEILTIDATFAVYDTATGLAEGRRITARDSVVPYTASPNPG